MGRLKTGTPARIKMSSLNLGVMEEQPGDSPTPFMSSLQEKHPHPTQLSCYITRTTPATKKIMRKTYTFLQCTLVKYQESGLATVHPSKTRFLNLKTKRPTKYSLSPKASMLIWYIPTAYQAAYPNNPRKIY